MKPIRRVLVYEQVLDRIIKKIKEDGIKKGDRLPSEKEIANQLGVSRNSVREALRILTISGLIEPVSGKGTFLRYNLDVYEIPLNVVKAILSRASVIELMEVRRILEIEASGLAAIRASEEERKAFGQLWISLKKAFLEHNKEEWRDKGYEFHNKIVDMSGNILLKKLYKHITKELRNIRQVLVKEQGIETQQMEDHEKIFQAIMDGNGELARTFMQQHLNKVEEELKFYLGKEPFQH